MRIPRASSRLLTRGIAAVATVLASAVWITSFQPAAATGASEDAITGKAKREALEVKSTPVREIRPTVHKATDRATRSAMTTVPLVAWPRGGVATLDIASGPVVQALGAHAEGLPVSLGKSTGLRRVKLEVADRAATARLGVDGVVLRLSPIDAPAAKASVHVTLDYSAFANGYGADWSRRLKLVQLPACAWTTPTVRSCLNAVDLRSANESSAKRITAELRPASTPTVVAAVAATSSDAGDFAATSLSPSASWKAGGSSGDFAWSYPFRVPPAVGGPEPKLALEYSAQSVDGRTASTNNQPSWVGEGFDIASSFIERKYQSCQDDGHTGKGDLCWRNDNATLMLNGNATELVPLSATVGPGKQWRLKNDDGSRVDQLVNSNANGDNDKEYWRVTTTDGMQYFFGRHVLPGWTTGKPTTNSTLTVPVVGDDDDDPCNSSAGFASSFCNQGWRWMLDYVVDPNGNTMTYWYSRENNYYARNGVASDGVLYQRGAVLSRIEYGTRSDTIFAAAAPMRVVFGASQRCIVTAGQPCSTLNEASKGAWPDVPFDQICEAGDACTGKVSPAFFSRLRLTSVTTQLYSGGAYEDVDQWALTQSFPANGDDTSPGLWLNSIRQTGKVGTSSVTLPPVTFEGDTWENRVDADEGYVPLRKFRVGAIVSETGGRTTIGYQAAECTRATLPSPASNTKRCYPAYWTPPRAADPVLDWFHKYVVAYVQQDDLTTSGLPVVTYYAYGGGAAWRYDDGNGLIPPKYRTWSDWRGFATVQTVVGDPSEPVRSKSIAQYFRGMNGDRASDSGGVKEVNNTDSDGSVIPDEDRYAGFLSESRVFNGLTGAEISGEVHVPWTRQTASIGNRAHMLRTQVTRTRIALDNGRGVRRTNVIYDYSTDGLVIETDDRGDIATTADDRCTRTTYAQNRTLGLLDYPSRAETVSIACAGTPTRPSDIVSDIRTAYDNLAVGAAPTEGNVTRTERITSHDGTSATYQTVATTTYDVHGRVTSVMDANNEKTTTAYTPTTGAPLTATVVTNARNHATTTNISPWWGIAVASVDPNGRRTDASPDPLGRIGSVWLPNRSKSAGQTASVKYGYTVSASAALAVSTSKILENQDGYVTSYELFDSLLRPRQTQVPSPAGGRIIADVVYDRRGLVSKKRVDLYNSSAPSATFVNSNDGAFPAYSLYGYDGAARQVSDALIAGGGTKWTTRTSYGGDRTYVDPPVGAPGTTTVTDARGNVIERHEHPGGAPSGTSTKTTYGYDHADRLARITDVAGNDWTYSYDLRGRQITTVDPDKGQTTSTYDNLDRLTATTDARGKKLAYAWDELGRKTGLFENSTGGTKLAGWTYDTVEDGLGLPATSTRFDGGNAYTRRITKYDAMNRATRSFTDIPAAEGSLAGSYQSDWIFGLTGILEAHIIPEAGGLPTESLAYSYTPDLGLPKQMAGLAQYVEDVRYTAIGDVFDTVLATRADRQMVMTDTRESGTRRLMRTQYNPSDGDLISDRHLSYDQAGNITSVKELAGTSTVDELECFKLDGYRRLVDAWAQESGSCSAGPSLDVLGGPSPYWHSWSYTATGTRASQTFHAASGDILSTYAYPAAGGSRPHAVSSVTSGSVVRSFGYDASGNTTSRVNPVSGAAQTLTWDLEGRLDTVTEAGATSSNVYDADGNLLIRRDATETVLYVDGTEVHRSASGAISGVRYYEFGGKTIMVRNNAGRNWLITDHHNTPVVNVNADTHAVNRRRENPFGRLRTLPSLWVSTRGFVGGTTHEATDLVHLGARDYDPVYGMFLSVDPLLNPADPQSLNAYSYGNNNPATFSDPSGLKVDHEDAPCHGCSPAPPPRVSQEELKSRAKKRQEGAESYRRYLKYLEDREQERLQEIADNKRAEAWNSVGIGTVSSDPSAPPTRIPLHEPGIGYNPNSPAVLAVELLAPADVLGCADGPVECAIGAAMSAPIVKGPRSIRRVTKALTGVKRINLPGWKKVKIDMEHVLSGHTKGGARVSPRKDIFPEGMTERQIAHVVRQAYRNSEKDGPVYDNMVHLLGDYDGWRYGMWLDLDAGMITTAYPLGRVMRR